MDNQREHTVLHLYHRLLALKLLPRTGWLQRGIANVESIAEHSFGVASLALIIGDMQPDLDRGRLLAIALLHDMAEALTGDLPASARLLFGAQAKRDAERQAMIELFAGLPQANEYLDLWTEYTEGSSREARLVKSLDRLEMLLQALAYEQAGNQATAEFWADIDTVRNAEFPLLETLTSQLMAARGKLNGATKH